MAKSGYIGDYGIARWTPQIDLKVRIRGHIELFCQKPLNFREPDTCEVRRTPLPRTSLNRGKKKGRRYEAPALVWTPSGYSTTAACYALPQRRPMPGRCPGYRPLRTAGARSVRQTV
jgi:hypothetical protein